VDQSYNGSSPENAGTQPPAPAGVPFAGNFPAPVGPPVQPSAVPPPAGTIPVLAPQASNGLAKAPNGYPAPSSGFVTATAPGAPPQTVPMPQSPLLPGAPGLTPAQGMPDMPKVARNTRGTEVDTDMAGWDLNALLIQVLERKCSDLHMTIGAPPTIRLNGSLLPRATRS
jgi:twitching motility protein PilT